MASSAFLEGLRAPLPARDLYDNRDDVKAAAMIVVNDWLAKNYPQKGGR